MRSLFVPDVIIELYKTEQVTIKNIHPSHREILTKIEQMEL